MRFHSYLNSAKKIIEDYSAEQPLAIFMKRFFAKNKKYGSRDRRTISDLCYSYLRMGKALADLPIEEKIVAAVFLCHSESNEFLKFHRSDWDERVGESVSGKMKILGVSSADVFPWENELSEEIDYKGYTSAFFQQPKLFLRIRPGQKDFAIKKLDAMFRAKGMANPKQCYELLGDDCIALPNATKLGEVFQADKEVVIQDLNSQRVLNFLKTGLGDGGNSEFDEMVQLWDCCAASGGKSILAHDLLEGKVELSVSDVRQSILENLKRRFAKAGIKEYDLFKADLTASNFAPPSKDFQLTICDAPCSGSGTWSRTPEQLWSFEKDKMEEYVGLQRKIVSKVVPSMQAGGYFVYITCSVFKAENEEVVEFIQEQFDLELLEMKLLPGYMQRADTMFTALLKKS